MNADDHELRRHEARRWLAILEEDLRVSRQCLAMDPIALGTGAYHCQQAVEKTLKALLVVAGVGFRRTHDLDELVDLAREPHPELAGDLTEVRRLTYWGTAYRYPEIEEEIEPLPSVAEIEAALASVERLVACLVEKLA
jgi:HEPN domain-containing protein